MSTYVKNNERYLKCIIFYLIIICFPTLIASCGDKDDPDSMVVPTEDVYVITFTGDCDKFKGEISVSVKSSNCHLVSSSFESYNHMMCSDPHFKEKYDLKLYNYDKSTEASVEIHCSALIISQQNYSMKCNIYRMKMDGTTLKYEKEFVSYNPDYHPASQEYTFTIKL